MNGKRLGQKRGLKSETLKIRRDNWRTFSGTSNLVLLLRLSDSIVFFKHSFTCSRRDIGIMRIQKTPVFKYNLVSEFQSNRCRIFEYLRLLTILKTKIWIFIYIDSARLMDRINEWLFFKQGVVEMTENLSNAHNTYLISGLISLLFTYPPN